MVEERKLLYLNLTDGDITPLLEAFTGPPGSFSLPLLKYYRMLCWPLHANVCLIDDLKRKEYVACTCDLL